VPLDFTDDPETLRHRLGLMSQALLNVLVAAGMVRQDVDAVSGPELLTAADTYCEAIARVPNHDLQLIVGDRVDREDGRFYIPVSMAKRASVASNIVLRVASDAFTDEFAPVLFADEVARRWNEAIR
jgi:hypothetical protein